MKNTLFFVNYKALHVILILIFTLLPNISNASEVNVYSGRKAKLIKPLLDQFQKQTGITVNLVTAKSDALIKRLEAEGESSPADIFITVDAGRLERAKKMGLLQDIDTSKLKISSNYIDKDNKWVGLSKRIRTIVYSKKSVNKGELLKFEDLSLENWNNRICVRSSNNIYNQSLVASLIFNLGEKQTEKIIKKIVNNFARKPSGNDRAQITAVAKNECDVAIVNHYYYILMLNSKDVEKRKIANKVDIAFLNQNDRGSHVNISGVGIAKNSKNIINANKLIKFLLNKESQEWYAETNNEYPVLQNARVTGALKNWGEIKLDEKSINKLGDLNPNAVKLMDRVGWK
mgnify:FL=1|tara:strand:+ start:628 stop:1662 length:1035 start_codon:yes stop_codon:yes gene_type:complete